MSEANGTCRGVASGRLWWLMWGALSALCLVMLIDGIQRSIPVVLWPVWFIPLAVLVPGMLRDRLRSITWLSFVSLLYFVLAVLRVFAEPHSLRSQIELIAVIALFLSSMFYIRERARELRPEVDDSELTDEE